VFRRIERRERGDTWTPAKVTQGRQKEVTHERQKG